jgi:glycosyltransferase involved in cell wall biosynthesis
MQPFGGSEIQLAYLAKYVSKDLLSKIKLELSVPERSPVVIDRTNVLWIQNSYDQPNVHPWFKNKLNHGKYDWYVFNSHWVYEKYRYFFDIPTEQSIVIKNGFTDDLVLRKNFKRKSKIKLVYTSTPWRGLEVLLRAMELVKSDKVELDVYSSTQIYGDQFKEQADDQYKPLYDKAKSLKNVNYKGFLHHDELVKILHTYDAFVYPNVWEETSCIAAIEALACGLVAVTTDHGALYETCADFPIYVPYLKDREKLAHQFAYVIDTLPELLNNIEEDKLKFQMQYYKQFYHWNIIKGYWENFLNGIK